MKSSTQMLGMACWALCSIGALNWGLDAMGQNLFHLGIFQYQLAGMVVPLKYLIGLCGAYSLVQYVQAVMSGKGCNIC